MQILCLSSLPVKNKDHKKLVAANVREYTAKKYYKNWSERWSQQFAQEMKKAEEKRCKCMIEIKKKLAKMVHWPGDDGIEKIKSKELKTWRTGGFYHQLLFKWKTWSVYSTLTSHPPLSFKIVWPKKWLLVAIKNCRYAKANDLLLILHACDEVRNTQEFTRGVM